MNGNVDDQTKYSTATSVAPSVRHKYIQELCQDLFGRVPALQDVEGEQWLVLSSPFRTLIKKFALQIGYEGSLECLRIMDFLHRYNR